MVEQRSNAGNTGENLREIPDNVKRLLRNVTVDLTPVLPGGENGGAKIFVLELLQRMAAMAPDTQFVLLTRPESHDELASMDSHNIRRMQLGGTSKETAPSAPPQRLFMRRLQAQLPVRLAQLVQRISAKAQRFLSRRAGQSVLRTIQTDLLFCPFTAPLYYEPGVPVVSTLYDLQYKTYPAFFSSQDIAQRDQTFRDACRHATVLAAISDYSRQSALRHSDLPPERIRTVYLRMARRLLPKDQLNQEVLERLGLSRQRYLLYPANFWKHKNHEQLLTAFGMACREGLAPDIRLVCTGAPGARRDWLMQASTTMGLQERILFPGYLPNAELESLLAHCLGMVFPSLYEGFGLPVIEAMAAGVPVACSNTTSLPEVADNAAIFFDPRIPQQISQAMIALTEDQHLRTRLIEAGSDRARTFEDSNRMAREYWELFAYAVADPLFRKSRGVGSFLRAFRRDATP